MSAASVQSCTAFAGHRLIASGAPREVVVAVKAAVEAGEGGAGLNTGGRHQAAPQ
jgi:hypothetical protein